MVRPGSPLRAAAFCSSSRSALEVAAMAWKRAMRRVSMRPSPTAMDRRIHLGFSPPASADPAHDVDPGSVDGESARPRGRLAAGAGVELLEDRVDVVLHGRDLD